MAVLQYLGEVEVERMTLVNNLGMGVNILPIFKEISIFQHINLPTLTAEIEIEEATGFSEVFPILGMERLDVTFRTKTGLGQFEKSFNVTSMTQKENVTNKRAVNYLLHCVSGEYFKSETKRISKTYSGTISDIINDIYKEHIKILRGAPSEELEGDEDDLNVLTESSGQFKFVVPNWTPFQTIEWLLKKAVSTKSNAANFVFYETMNGFYLDSMDRLMEEDPWQVYHFSPVNVKPGGTRQFAYDFTSVTDFEIIRPFPDTLKSLQKGMYASKLITHDITTKEIKVQKFDYMKEFASRNHLGITQMLPLQGLSHVDGPAKKLHEAEDAVINVYPKHTYLHATKDNNNNQFQNHAEDWIQQRCSDIQTMNSIEIQIKIPGNHALEVGDVVAFNPPQFKSTEKKLEVNEYLSGKFLVTRVRHNVSKEYFTSIVSLSKDSFESGVGSPTAATVEQIVNPYVPDYTRK